MMILLFNCQFQFELLEFCHLGLKISDQLTHSVKEHQTARLKVQDILMNF